MCLSINLKLFVHYGNNAIIDLINTITINSNTLQNSLSSTIPTLHLHSKYVTRQNQKCAVIQPK